MGVRVRPATREDLDAIVAIERASFSDPWSPRLLGDELEADPRRRPFVALDDDRIVGFALFWVIVDEIHLVNVAVAPEARRRGVAQAMLDHVLTTEAGRRAAIMTLEVRVTNEAAIAFYRRNGFVDVALRPRYYPDTGEDALVMLKTLRGPSPGAAGRL